MYLTTAPLRQRSAIPRPVGSLHARLVKRIVMFFLGQVVDLVACFLGNKEPLACVASFARCSCHYNSYLVSSDTLSCFRCSFCEETFQCHTTSHTHHGAVIVYAEAPLGRRYGWQTLTDRVACSACLIFLGTLSENWDRQAEELLAVESSSDDEVWLGYDRHLNWM